jgi:diguanylate cyclase (GGDEF)-like protein
MLRLFKKYKLLVWLGLLLVLGLVANSAVMLVMSGDLLLQQSAGITLPVIGDSLNAELQLSIARAVNLSAKIADDAVLREWLISDEPDNDRLVEHLRAQKQKDNSISHFLITEKDQKYIDSLGTVRSVNQDGVGEEWYVKAHESTRPYEISIVPQGGAENHLIMFVSYRLRDAEQRVAGIAGLNVALDTVSKSINRYGADGSRAVYFVDRSGNIVLSDKKSGLTGNIRQLPGISLVADELLKDQSGTFSNSYDKNKERTLFNARYIPELGWYLVVEQNGANVTRAVWPLAYVNAAVGTLITVLALLIAGFSIAQHQHRLRALANRDSMTGLMNRQSFTNSFQQTVLEMQRLKLPLSFILFDIDYFKKINESHGHATGDRIIMDIARMSKGSVRGSDLICRWGGEQVALLLRRCELEQAYKIAEQLRLNVQNHPFAFDDREASVTISLGVAEWTDNESLDELFGRVDEAVYLAKSEGRNRAEISYYVNV